jgi:hypothetical protein
MFHLEKTKKNIYLINILIMIIESKYVLLYIMYIYIYTESIIYLFCYKTILINIYTQIYIFNLKIKGIIFFNKIFFYFLLH